MTSRRFPWNVGIQQPESPNKLITNPALQVLGTWRTGVPLFCDEEGRGCCNISLEKIREDQQPYLNITFSQCVLCSL